MKLKISDFTVGDTLHDAWWPYIYGRVIRKNTRSLYLETADGVIRYDAAHCQFLRKD
jgi:hypothetical protein